MASPASAEPTEEVEIEAAGEPVDAKSSEPTREEAPAPAGEPHGVAFRVAALRTVIHNGRTYGPGEVLPIDEAQAESLGDFVVRG